MIHVKCKTCGGTGKAPLSAVLEGTLDVVRRNPGGSAQKYKIAFLYIGATALNQRLEDLRALGLVWRERRSRSWVYFPMKDKR